MVDEWILTLTNNNEKEGTERKIVRESIKNICDESI